MKTKDETSAVESTGPDSTGKTARRTRIKGLSRLVAYLRGKEILILGPGHAGKTKFAQYLRWAVLDPEGKREMTFAVTESPTFVVRLGGEEGPELNVRRTVDTPGQVGPLHHAQLVARRRPHAVIVMLDCSVDPSGTSRWFRLFCDALDTVLRKTSPAARRLEEMIVILNKRDKIADKEYAELRLEARKALERHLSVVWGEKRVRLIPIVECVSVQTGYGTALIDGVIAQLAQRLAGQPEQQDAPVAPKVVAAAPAGPRPRPLRPSPRPVPTSSSRPRRPTTVAPAV